VDAKSIGRQIALGMAAAHAQGIVHGDLKPANIMVGPDGFAKVMDFGLAHRQRGPRSTDETATWGSAGPVGLSGTPAYMSPEQARSEPASMASDVFSLGLLLYEMATGQRAIRGDNLFDVLREIDALDAEAHAAGLPEPVATVVRRALVREAGKRDVTMHDIAQLLAHDQSIASV
jgi:serine/threonine-protein kinase